MGFVCGSPVECGPRAKQSLQEAYWARRLQWRGVSVANKCSMEEQKPSDSIPTSGTPASSPTGQPIVRPYPLPELRPGEFYVEPIDPASVSGQSIYCIERDDPFDHFVYRAKSIVCAATTPFQHVVIADTYNYGRALFMDSKIQSSQDDEALYHEMLVQPAM